MSKIAANEGFQVEWEEPAEAELTWVWDAAHFPNPMTPLSKGLWERCLRDRAIEMGLEKSQTIRCVFGQGFPYLWRPFPVGSVATDPLLAERARLSMEAVPRMTEIWNSQYKSEIEALCKCLQNADYGSMSLQELASRMEGYVADSARTWVLTILQAEIVEASRNKINKFTNRQFGEKGEFITGILTEGFENDTRSSDIALWELARLANSLPEVAEAFGRLDEGDLISELPRVQGGEEFLSEFHKYLDVYGWRADWWIEISDPTWQDDPRPALGLVKRYLGRKDETPREALERLATSRRELTEELREKFSSDAEMLSEFEEVLEAAEQFVPIKEGRARLQLVGTGSLRVPCLALGRKLKVAGLVDDVDDVFYLHVPEIQQISDGEPKEDLKALVADRKADREYWKNNLPPDFVGTPPVESGLPSPADEAGSEEGQPKVLRGLAASKGVAHGRATLIRTLEEASNLAEGDILVCRSTSPSWTPLVARSSAVVTDTGGVLAHTAIVAREFGIPCVVGTNNATSIIKDGMFITVNGGDGTVLLGK